MTSITTDELLQALYGVTSPSHARAMISHASRVAGVRSHRALDAGELLLVCEALIAEGGPIQAIAEAMATRALREIT